MDWAEHQFRQGMAGAIATLPIAIVPLD